MLRNARKLGPLKKNILNIKTVFLKPSLSIFYLLLQKGEEQEVDEDDEEEEVPRPIQKANAFQK